MNRDFTLETYTRLLRGLKEANYAFCTFEDFCEHRSTWETRRFVMLRHDVDLKAENALAVAKIEHDLGIVASYYFRVVEQSNKPEIIRAIAELGHEIGYHYEDMTVCDGDVERAITHFKGQLDYVRQFYPVRTICMHGAPRSKYDSRDLWKHYDYHDFDVVGEPYFDVDFSNLFYLTDTGRRWDGFHVSVRDKIPYYQDQWVREGLVYHATQDIIDAIEGGRFPERLMMTTHPQRWTDNNVEWMSEWFSQSMKNVVKKSLVRKKS